MSSFKWMFRDKNGKIDWMAVTVAMTTGMAGLILAVLYAMALSPP